MIKVLFLIYASAWRVNNYVSRQGEGGNKRNESTIIIIIKIFHCTVLQILRTCKNLINCRCLNTCFDWKPTFLSCVILNLRSESNSVFKTVEIFAFSKIMATRKNKRKLAALARETQEYPGNNQSQNSAAPGITEDYIAQVSKKIEGRVIKKLSQEFSRTESRILGELSKLDEFLLNPQIRRFSGTTPGTFRNTDVENQEPTGDRSQNDPHPEVEFSACRASNLTDSDPKETSHNHPQQTKINFLNWYELKIDLIFVTEKKKEI